VAHYLLARGLQSLVVAGTHGKTTTSSMLAWILEHAGCDPSYLVGGMPRWNRRPYRLGSGSHVVIEGDEYNTCFFDRGPKFLHYRPQLFVLGPVEFDHADIYRDLAAVMTAFRAGAAQVPSSGRVVVNAWSGHAVEAARDTAAQLISVGPGSDCSLRVTEPQGEGSRTEAVIRWAGTRHRLMVPMAGEHNLHNAALAVAAAISTGLDPAAAVTAIGEFPGIARRQEVVGEAAGITVVDDFAHHPTALAVTIEAARQLWPGRRLVVVFEPRSLTAARRSFQDAYLMALRSADFVMVAPLFHRNRLAAEETMSREQLAAELANDDIPSLMPADGDDPAELLLPHLREGDVVLGCSSGSFDGFHRRLLDLLSDRDHPR
jgi:UDP-N-acetylmuramate: L-alanyl-gamma-D-glutamyl-meso-diaminopimelate ligase